VCHFAGMRGQDRHAQHLAVLARPDLHAAQGGTLGLRAVVGFQVEAQQLHIVAMLLACVCF